MKINIYQTVDVSDEQRVAIARLLDPAGSKKRQATRDEMKAFIWLQGEEWEVALGDGASQTPVPEAEDESEDEEDLLGGGVEADVEDDDLL